MPRLNEYISIGFCESYGDADFRVSMKVCDLSRKRFDELKLATLTALRVADEHWLRKNNEESVEAYEGEVNGNSSKEPSDGHSEQIWD
jgi:hypothetical protein